MNRNPRKWQRDAFLIAVGIIFWTAIYVAVVR